LGEEVVGVKQGSLEQFGIAGKESASVEGGEEVGIDDGCYRLTEDTDLVLESAVVDTRFSTMSSINHSQQSGGDIDIVNTSLVSGSSKTSKVGDDTASDIDEQGMACGMVLEQKIPNGLDRLQRLIRFHCAYTQIRVL
jgi:hypothetical protein